MQIQDLPLLTPAMVSMPKYRQLAAIIEEYLQHTSPQPGEKFFTDRQLAKHFSTTVVTISHSLNYLCSKGLLVRRVGAGTFVSGQVNKTGKNRIGIFCHEMICSDNFYVTPILSRFGKFFSTSGYDVISFCASPADYRRLIAEYELSGVMIFVPKEEFAPEIAQLAAEGIPVISIGYAIPELRGTAFGTDHEASMSLAVDYLCRQGKKKIGLLHCHGHASSAVFLRGYQKAMWQHNLPQHPDWHFLIKYDNPHQSWEQFAECFSALQAIGEAPEAIIIGSVSQTGNIYYYAQQNNLRIPEDLSLLLCGDVNLAHENCLLPPLPVIRQKTDIIADNAAKALLNKIAGQSVASIQCAIPPELTIQEFGRQRMNYAPENS